MKWTKTTILWEICDLYDFTPNEYAIIDAIRQLSKEGNNANGWCYASNSALGKALRVSEKFVRETCRKAEFYSLILRHEEATKGAIILRKTTSIWAELVEVFSSENHTSEQISEVRKKLPMLGIKFRSSEKTSADIGKNFRPTSEESSDNIYIDTNIDNECVRTREEEQKEEEQITPLLENKPAVAEKIESVGNSIPTDMRHPSFAPSGYPLPYEQLDAQIKVLSFLELEENRNKLAELGFSSAARKFTYDQWASFVQYFIGTLFSEKNNHIARELKDFPSLLNRAAQWLKNYRMGTPSSDIFMKICSLRVDNKINDWRNSNQSPALLQILAAKSGLDIAEYFAPTVAKINAYSENLRGISPINETELLKLYLLGEKDNKPRLILQAMEDAPKVKYVKKYNRFYDAVIAQYEFINSQK